jgi:aminoglycoside phosphotransferase family enzyme
MSSARQAYPELVQAMLKPSFYDDGTRGVEMVETHISYIFLTDRHAYKVKKSVDLGFLDFTMLERRRHFCHREVMLNRRLSPRVYLGVVDIRRGEGGFNIGGPGETIEYGVKMRRLPSGRALEEMLKRGEVSERDGERVAQKIAGFHAMAETGPSITRLGGMESLRRNIAENFEQTRKYVGRCMSTEEYEGMRRCMDEDIEAKAGLMRRREEQGRVRDGHGDLHAGNVFLENGISIIDCIEFNERFRYADVGLDVAFLAMDLDYFGRPDLSRAFVRRYGEASGDGEVEELMGLFKSYRAYVRGKVTCFKLEGSGVSKGEALELEERAQGYFRLAASYMED